MAATMTRAALVREMRGPQEVDEASLLAEVPFILQAVTSKSIKFTEPGAQLTCTLSSPLVQLVSMLIEAGLLYRKLTSFINTDGNITGLVRQSLKAVLSEEITSYLNKVSVIQSQIREQVASDTDPFKVTLKRVILWTKDDVLRLRLMNHMLEQIGSTNGGESLTKIYTLSCHGDPFIQQFTRKVLKEVSVPFYEMLAKWIYEGELLDPHAEFLVQPSTSASSRNPGRPGSSDSTEDAWKGKYILVDAMVPSFVSSQLAQKIYLIGKSLNFIRYTCNDADFVIQHTKKNKKTLNFDDTALLGHSIDDAYAVTSQHLRSLMFNKFHLLDHLQAIKKYILLNAGDFISVLMERLGDSLEHPASTLHRHNLTSSLGDAIQTSNAQHEPDHIIQHLDARMLEGVRGTIGWEVFTLEYRLGKPGDVIVTDHSARQYLKIFNFLWRLKRVEFALSTSWRRQVTGERGMLNQIASVAKDWQAVRGTSAEMIHFVCQLQYYILYEVVEDSWQSLKDAITKPACDLDGIIAAHSTYLKSIIDKALLGSHQRSKDKDEREEDCLSLLHEILKTILSYKDQVDQLFSFTLSQYTTIQTSSRRRAYNDTKNDSTVEKTESIDESLTLIRGRLEKLSREFRESTSFLLAALSYQKSETMRFLAVRLNYNEFYTIPKPRKVKKEKEHMTR